MSTCTCSRSALFAILKYCTVGWHSGLARAATSINIAMQAVCVLKYEATSDYSFVIDLASDGTRALDGPDIHRKVPVDQRSAVSWAASISSCVVVSGETAAKVLPVAAERRPGKAETPTSEQTVRYFTSGILTVLKKRLYNIYR
jgi:hypothetical protein